MEELKNKVKQVLADLENKLKDKEELEYAKTKVFELYETFADELEKLQETCSSKIDTITAKYALLETKMQELEGTIDRIKTDIYIEEKEDYDLDIICPYCDAEFTIDTTDELKNSVKCPECNNIIELDWNEEGCGHDCSECHHDCNDETDEEDEDM